MWRFRYQFRFSPLGRVYVVIFFELQSTFCCRITPTTITVLSCHKLLSISSQTTVSMSGLNFTVGVHAKIAGRLHRGTFLSVVVSFVPINPKNYGVFWQLVLLVPVLVIFIGGLGRCILIAVCQWVKIFKPMLELLNRLSSRLNISLIIFISFAQFSCWFACSISLLGMFSYLYGGTLAVNERSSWCLKVKILL